MYNPHAKPDIMGEMAVMSRGRLVKARLSDQDPPNVSWYWIPVGNCHACKHYQRNPSECLDDEITPKDFQQKYMFSNDCPEFEAGTPTTSDIRDVMIAAGLTVGTPSQEVQVIRDVPWSVDAALDAHREQSMFLHMAHHADRIADGSVTNDPSRGEYVDLSDDLERPEQNTEPNDMKEKSNEGGVAYSIGTGQPRFGRIGREGPVAPVRQDNDQLGDAQAGEEADD